MHVFDQSPCQLGEGPLWHPLRQQLYWFDILAKTLYAKGSGELKSWQFPEMVSAAGWIDRDHLLIASESALFKFNLLDGQQSIICPLEADNPIPRSNDGRADPWGGFWIGTMGKKAEPAAGAIYRYYRGELRKIKAEVSISNAICFAPDSSCSYYTDTAEQIIWRQPLDPQHGWPSGERQMLIDLQTHDLNPDGAVCDAQGNLWIAQWGAARIAQYSSRGELLQSIAVPTAHTTCPAFGGQQLNRLFITTARQGLSDCQLHQQPAGQTFYTDLTVCGQSEHSVIID